MGEDATTICSRRGVMRLGAAAATSAALGWNGVSEAAPLLPRFRVIVDNDLSGDPDGLFQLAHHMLSPSVAVSLIVGSHLHAGETWGGDKATATAAAKKGRELLALMGMADRAKIVAGAETAIPARTDWKASGATAAIVAEAMRTDSKLPLFYAAGAGLTELALAWLSEPAIGKRLKLVWIGGSEHPGMAYPPPGEVKPEYNLTIDRIAAQIIFGESDIEIWQIPRDAYRQMLFSTAELEALAETGPLGAHLKREIDRVVAMMARSSGGTQMVLGETYVLGDSPLVTLTALQSSFEPDPSSSRYTIVPTPRIGDDGFYAANPQGRPMRVYTSIDTRLTFADMVRKIGRAETRPAPR